MCGFILVRVILLVSLVSSFLIIATSSCLNLYFSDGDNSSLAYDP